MSRHVRLIAVCASLLAAAGCSGDRRLPTAPGGLPPTAPAAAPLPDSQRLAALALFEAAFLHAEITTSPLNYAIYDGKVWTNGPCGSGSGSMQASLDGGPAPAPGTSLPTGSHTYVVSFTDCLVDVLAGIQLNGVASAAYSAAEWSNLTARVSADSVRGTGLSLLSRLYDVTADGPAVWTSVGTRTGSSTRTTTYFPATGARLVNNSTSSVATFGGGSYSKIQHPPPQGMSGRVEWRFDTLKIAISGTEYTLHGSLDTAYGFSSTTSHTGEIRIISNGTLVARIHGDARSALTIEVLVPLVPL